MKTKKFWSGFSLTTKILVIFLTLSVVSLVVVGYLSFINMWEVSDYVLKSSTALGKIAISDSTNVIEDLGAQIIEQKSRDVVKQCEIYIKSHPNMRLTDLQKSTEFQKIAVQPVGKTGYTALTDYAILTCRFHISPRIINLDLHNLAKKLPGFWGVMSLSQGGKESFGYYDWEEPDGSIRKKYMHIIPIKAKTADGIEMSVAATTYIDEFSKPVETIKSKIFATIQDNKKRINKQINNAQNTFIGIFIVILLLLVAGLASLLSRTITRPIKMLQKGSESIGKGDLDYKVEVKTGDELEELADSFNKMSSDLKKYIDELQRTTAEKEMLAKEKERKEKEELVRWNKILEEKVEERTREIEKWSRTLENRVEKGTEEIRKKSEEVEMAMDELKELNKELDSFVYTASHDLKEPLRGIETFSKFLLADYGNNLDDQGKDYLKRISAGANRMKNLIDDLLIFSRITRAKRPFASINTREILREATKRLESIITERNVELKIREDLPIIYGDEVKIVEVFYNLLSNAIKYNDREKPIIEIDCPIPQPKDEVIIWVKDNGIGIDNRYYDEIFKIFKRLHIREEYGGGTGAGLAIVKRIIEEHNGRIWVESELSRGSKFYISIPKAVGSKQEAVAVNEKIWVESELTNESNSI